MNNSKIEAKNTPTLVVNTNGNNENTNNNNNTNSALKQTLNRPLRSFIGTISNGAESRSEKKPPKTDKKIGHREVKDGVVHYKKVSTDELKRSIQFGIVHSISASNKYPERDLLMQDFQTVETIVFPKGGSLHGGTSTPPHAFNDFKLKVYAPYGFKYLRKKFNVDEADYMKSISETELKEISNPGASGSVFYRTSDDKYILKTVQYEECAFLKKLLAGIYLKNEKTNIRVVVMNNILPSNIKMHEKYDLKGSLYKRKASRQERSKTMPTYKDLDFLEEHPDGIVLEDKYYDNIVSSLKRDCLILKSFGIMDYSLLLGIHNLEKERNTSALDAYLDLKANEQQLQQHQHHHQQQQHQNDTNTANAANLSSNEQKTITNSTSNNKSNKFFSLSAVPARNAKGDRLLLYMGIIDILQSYRFKKRIEHTLKSMITDGNQISVCHPEYYENRFIDFVTSKVFRKVSNNNQNS